MRNSQNFLSHLSPKTGLLGSEILVLSQITGTAPAHETQKSFFLFRVLGALFLYPQSNHFSISYLLYLARAEKSLILSHILTTKNSHMKFNKQKIGEMILIAFISSMIAFFQNFLSQMTNISEIATRPEVAGMVGIGIRMFRA